ncbi:zinc finger BED domain-containing protein 1-like [Myzus persicae]|uniref:zinc finger BED domain-containing protein 1-like n=1 Tax=Myzus persicae TaxID=13164 RepID=UPI000B938C10|nr:zinc finger BED domain-containing protein 1-like [Myzus persicae]
MVFTKFGAPSEKQVTAFHKAIVKMIAEDLQPLSIVENAGFRSMIELLDSRYEIPSRRALGRTIIPNIFSSVQNKVQVLLDKAVDVAITTDVWTSLNTDSYLTLTVHFLKIMTNELHNWNIFNKVVAVVTDGGANIRAAVRLMNLSHLPCIAHKLNLVVQQALKLCDDEGVGPENDSDEGDLKNSFEEMPYHSWIFQEK